MHSQIEDPCSTLDHEVRTELDRILLSPDFQASERNRQFLIYIVEETLSGRSDRIKAYCIATQVFGRGDDFDPVQDSIVRIEAARLRRELEHFYLKQGPGPKLEISIPKGAYVPKFTTSNMGKEHEVIPSDTTAAPRGLNQTGPRILVQTLDEDRYADHVPDLGTKITRQLILSLTRYTELFVYAFPTSNIWSGQREGAQQSDALEIDYALSGTVTIADDKFYVEVLLQRCSDGYCIWTTQHEHTLAPDPAPIEIIEACQSIAGHVTRHIAERDGILDSQVRDTAMVVPQSFDGFRKVLEFHEYWRNLEPEMFEPLRLDLESTVATDPRFALGYSCLSMMYSNAARYDYDVSTIGQAPLERALDLAQQAIRLSPSSSHAYHARGIAQWFSGMIEESLETLEFALSLNPNDCEVMSELGLRRAMQLDWTLALPLLSESYKRNPLQPANYRMALFFYHFSQGRYEEALKEADSTGAPGIAQVHIACAAALSKLGHAGEARNRLRVAEKILPDLRLRLTEDLHFRQINHGLVDAIVAAIGDVDPGWRPSKMRRTA